MAGPASKKICYYEVLGLDRKCDATEIKASYRKLALRMHPDKAQLNDMSLEEATKKFQQIQEAYAVLSDAQERAWYDAHREQILRGDDEPGEDPFKTKINLYRYFSSGCYEGFGDDSRGFFSVYSELFEAIDAEEEQWEDADEDHVAMPPFCRSDAEWADVANFYRQWLDFCSRKAFGHADQWNPKEGQNRQVRRAMEQENKKARQAAKKEFNAEVRQLVKFVQKRDPRVAAHQKQQMKDNVEKTQREKAEKDRKKLDETKDREQKREAARLAEEERWAEAKALKEARRAQGDQVSEDENATDSSDDVDTVDYYCEPCRKNFKSEKAYDQHAKSKKHLHVVAKLRKELQREMEEERNNQSNKNNAAAAEKPGSDSDQEGESSRENQDVEEKGTKEDGEKQMQLDCERGENDRQNDASSENDSEDDFVARFSARAQQSKRNNAGHASGGGYPSTNCRSSPAENRADDEDDGDTCSEEDGMSGNVGQQESPVVDGGRGKRAQKREQLMAALLQRKQEKDHVENLVSGVRKKDRSNRQADRAESNLADGKDGAHQDVPDGNICGVCKEEFPSRSALFKHIKASGHAMLKPAPAEEAPKNRKKKR
eukprot:TRINITY_DN72411_c0_g1_i1.p1 TRINITY_DN72411_c0_g1~~TRINITY_DN72411_c0_g1_i1.p1  ORF type:complete len:601 (+),score=174.47 TRINITY_DN72411_c0_g1_i1:86-1888(+)